jgi:general secretion pathway protein I
MKRQRGFTLIETLVALAVIAIGLSAAMRAIGMATQSTAELRQRQLAQWVADNRLAEIRALRMFPGVGSEEGDAEQAGEKFRWHVDVKPTPNPLFRRVDIRVFGAGAPTPLAQLSGFAVMPLQ